MRSVESLAALTAKVLGMTRSASANSLMASCSREPMLRAKSSRCMARAASTAPPPQTTLLDSRTRLTMHMASCRERCTSSSMNSLAPRRTSEVERAVLQPRTKSSSWSPTRSSTTSSASPSEAGSTDSPPSRSAMLGSTMAPVATAMRLMSPAETRRTPMQPASMRYFWQRSSIPRVVRMTLAPAEMSFSIFSLVMSSSRWRMASSFLGSVTTICTPSCMRCFCRGKSMQAMRAPLMWEGMAVLERVLLRAMPGTTVDSRDERP
mmetsp:Transcript_23288/g.88277  ORF Transcript_23288/g.88277 Transcript_23288/m.88277 type:complete len:264 (-) Transcript_23288:611-1402(-)